jgi:hypothetical protein
LEKEAIAVEVPEHFRLAIGGDVDISETNLGEVGNGGSLKRLGIYGSSTGSLSVLVPGQGALTRRVCYEEHKANLIHWFSAMEILAWEWVNLTYPDDRPEKIFLVTGQTLTDEFYITHQHKGHSRCEVIVQGNGDVCQNVTNGLGYTYDSATAFFGFEVSRRSQGPDDQLFSIFLETYESRPIKMIRFEPFLLARLDDMFK